MCRVEIGLEAGGHLEHRKRERVLLWRKAVKSRASHRDAPWVEVVSRPGTEVDGKEQKGEGKQEGVRPTGANTKTLN